ncbi:8659_t:CDS:2 [Diversispora eburnea]|uniref:Mitochondrial import inner membrane translocase subunit TIM50 n=1 Tax=Diversispora eburnea TaxID=1213867 RepID=A0A9N9A6H5_9GLOM|nr:8659_t:CDS:2 [Diversispora eburnea]
MDDYCRATTTTATIGAGGNVDGSNNIFPSRTGELLLRPSRSGVYSLKEDLNNGSIIVGGCGSSNIGSMGSVGGFFGSGGIGGMKETNKQPSIRYIRTASIPSIKVEKSLPRLIILDLNGTLIHRTCSDIGKAILRPYIKNFMDYLFSGGYSVMVWSSAQPFNVKKMVKATFGSNEVKLIDVWTRDKFSLTNPQLQPYNSIHLAEFEGTLAFSGTDSELRDVIPYLEILKHQNNVSAYIKESPYRSSDYNSDNENKDNFPIISTIPISSSSSFVVMLLLTLKP